ncbi:hypothetical protein PHLCEN_2v2605 [Hermanssonia centrifuga]|uniref:SUI1 domain-containing protein n=1 Tax=Hermanssonia centrifuga TaxID=98765 RepID=A0A2R6RLI1_9APHY|nr:hypothetical protein PHLCEN_2v2605 [Hermanssonia centrifuga]
MAVSAETLMQADEKDLKGKAVYVLHTWKDSLWDLGTSKKMDVPEPRDIPSPTEKHDEKDVEDREGSTQSQTEHQLNLASTLPEIRADEEAEAVPGLESLKLEDAIDNKSEQSAPVLSPEDVSSCLRSAVIQAIQATLSSLPSSTFPLPASLFWTNYVLPARPAQALGSTGLVDSSAIDIKQSSHKSVKSFLKACAKEGLIKLKETKGDVVVTGIFPTHPAVNTHRPHRTVGSVEAKREKAEVRERKEKEAEEKKRGEIRALELWKPYGPTIGWFIAAEKTTEDLYSIANIQDIFSTYVSSKNLTNVNEQQYINVGEDVALFAATSNKNKENPEFLKRDDALKRIRDNMQEWHEIKTERSGVVRKKGQLKPISITVKMRQGRKAATLITGLEVYGIEPDDLADELRKACASSTSVYPLHGKTSELEVMVQGKQIKIVTDCLMARGVPKRWIVSLDQTGGKKK